MPKYTVIGFYPDTGQHFALYINAENSNDAEIKAANSKLYNFNDSEFDTPELVVVGVVEGHIIMTDKEPYIQHFIRSEDCDDNEHKKAMH